MKKYRNNIFMIIIAVLLAVGAKEYYKKFGYISLDSGTKVNEYLFKIYIVLSIIIILVIGCYGIYVLMNIKKIDPENVNEVFEKKLEVLMFINCIWSKLSICALAITTNQNYYLELKKFGRVPIHFLWIAIVLMLIINKYQNYLNPDKKINPFENRASAKYFNKLDEGEKWIAYKSSYAVFDKMNNFYYILFISIVLLSVFIEIPLILPIVVGLLPIVQQIIYNLEMRKFKG